VKDRARQKKREGGRNRVGNGKSERKRENEMKSVCVCVRGGTCVNRAREAGGEHERAHKWAGEAGKSG